MKEKKFFGTYFKYFFSKKSPIKFLSYKNNKYYKVIMGMIS